ncbi:MAG: M15 family metallopeptidase [Clostridia bacterium]|nr:M15 family metallopeptidase [Clostridia bacterium]
MTDRYDRSGFVLAGEAVPDAILEIRYYTTYNFVGQRIDGYEEPVALLTKEAAAALKAVSDDLRAQGYRPVIYDCYRPQRAVDHFVRWAEDLASDSMKPVFYPDVDKRDLFSQGFIAGRSGHSRGSTVDLTLLDERTGRLLDMGGAFDFFGERSHPSFTEGLTPQQYANRMLLRSAMLHRGFRPLSTEWWHFTLENEPYPDTYFDFPVRSR